MVAIRAWAPHTAGEQLVNSISSAHLSPIHQDHVIGVEGNTSKKIQQFMECVPVGMGKQQAKQSVCISALSWSSNL